MERTPSTYRIDLSKLTFREEVQLLPGGVRAFLARRLRRAWGAAASAEGGALLLRKPIPLALTLTLRQESSDPDSCEPSPLLKRHLAEARELGFKNPATFTVGPPLSPGARQIVFLRHGSGNAMLRLSDAHRPSGTIDVAFLTPLDDRGVALSSTERRATTLLPPSIAAFYHPGLPLTLLWEEHKRHVAELPYAAPAPLESEEELLHFHNTLERSIFVWRHNEALLIPLTNAEETALAQRVAVAQREQKRLRRGGHESRLAFASLQRTFAPPVGAPSLRGRSRPSPLSQGGWIDAFMVAMLLLFASLHQQAWHAWHNLALPLSLAAAFLLHGVGHTLGWRAVHRQKQCPTSPPPDLAWRRATALLLGPLPGFLLGIALLTAALFAPFPATLTQFGGVLLCLNGLTLLPLPFLDGGRLLRLLLYTRFPWLEPLARGALGCALAAGAAAMESLPLAFAALFTLATFPHQCRMAATAAHTLRSFRKAERRRNPGAPSEKTDHAEHTSSLPPHLAHTVVAVVRQVKKRLPHLATPERIAAAAHHFCEGAMVRPRSWRVASLFLALYVGLLLLPLLPATCTLFKSRQMAELALIGGAYQRQRDPIAPTALGIPVYIGLSEESAAPSATTLQTNANATAKAKALPQPTPRPPAIEGSFSSWY